MAIAIPANQLAMDLLVTVDDATVLPLSITDRYQSQNALLNMLARIGLGVKERFRLLHDGFTSIKSIVDLYHHDLESFKKMLHTDNKTWMSSTAQRTQSFFTPIMVHRLLGVMFYYKVSVKLFHLIPDCLLVDGARATTLGQLYARNISSKSSKTDDDDFTLPQLKEGKNWTFFKDSFRMVLGNTIGVRDIPLSYIIDDTQRAFTHSNNTQGEIATLDFNDETIFDQRTVHFGPEYKQDNHAVYMKLKEALLNKPGYNHISSSDRTKDGRAAWKSLKTFYEGEHYAKHLRETAFTKLHNTYYRGENKHFNFESYVNSHKESHKMLEDAGYNNGLGLDNETKIQYFRNGIKAEASLEIALSTSRANPSYAQFDALLSFLSAEVNHMKSRKIQLRQHEKRVSAAGRGGGGNNRRGGGRGNGNSNSNGRTYPFKWVDGKKIEGRWYKAHEFRGFNENQKVVAKQLLEQAQKGSNSSSKSGGISSLTRDQLQNDLNTFHEALIAGVSRANKDNSSTSDETPSVITENTNDSRTTADSGSVGNIFQNRNKRRKRE